MILPPPSLHPPGASLLHRERRITYRPSMHRYSLGSCPLSCGAVSHARPTCCSIVKTDGGGGRASCTPTLAFSRSIAALMSGGTCLAVWRRFTFSKRIRAAVALTLSLAASSATSAHLRTCARGIRNAAAKTVAWRSTDFGAGIPSSRAPTPGIRDFGSPR